MSRNFVTCPTSLRAIDVLRRVGFALLHSLTGVDLGGVVSAVTHEACRLYMKSAVACVRPEDTRRERRAVGLRLKRGLNRRDAAVHVEELAHVRAR